jgi:hypothetical protein
VWQIGSVVRGGISIRCFLDQERLHEIGVPPMSDLVELKLIFEDEHFENLLGE